MNPYEMLGVPDTASEAQIKTAYRRRARETHPDAGGNGDDFAKVSRAYAVLMDADARKHFDETGSLDEVAPLTVRQTMIQLMAGVFSEALAVEGQRGDLKHLDLVGRMRHFMATQAAQAKAQVEGMRKAVTDRQFMLKRITRPDDGENVFATIIETQVRDLAPRLKQGELQVKALEMAVEELKHYKNEVELVQAVQMMQFGGNFFAQNQTGRFVFSTSSTGSS